MVLRPSRWLLQIFYTLASRRNSISVPAPILPRSPPIQVDHFILTALAYHFLCVSRCLTCIARSLPQMHPVIVQSPGYYQVAGSIPAPQLPCLYAGAALVPDPTGADGTFLPTYISVREENVTADCAGYPTPECNAWSPVNGSAAEYYVPDLRFFLLSIKHGFTSSVGVAASAEEMDGLIADPSGKAIDSCIVYDQHGLACPVQRHLGAGHTDVIPVIALFAAAGIGYLDDEGGGVRGGVAGSVLRRSGFVLLVNIDYSNSFLSTFSSHGTGRYSDSYVQYTYRVSVGTAEPAGSSW